MGREGSGSVMHKDGPDQISIKIYSWYFLLWKQAEDIIWARKYVEYDDYNTLTVSHHLLFTVSSWPHPRSLSSVAHFYSTLTRSRCYHPHHRYHKELHRNHRNPQNNVDPVPQSEYENHQNHLNSQNDNDYLPQSEGAVPVQVPLVLLRGVQDLHQVGPAHRL